MTYVNIATPAFVFNTSRPRQNGRHFGDDIFIFIFIVWNVFWFKFHWNLLPRVILKLSQYEFRWWLGAEQAIRHYLIQLWPNLTTHVWITWLKKLKLMIFIIRDLLRRFRHVCAASHVTPNTVSACCGTNESNLKPSASTAAWNTWRDPDASTKYVVLCDHIEASAKWLTICKRHLKMHLLDRNMYNWLMFAPKGTIDNKST